MKTVRYFIFYICIHHGRTDDPGSKSSDVVSRFFASSSVVEPKVDTSRFVASCRPDNLIPVKVSPRPIAICQTVPLVLIYLYREFVSVSEYVYFTRV